MVDLNAESGTAFALDPAAQTDWSLIAAAVIEPAHRGRALDRLTRRYWPAIYAYCRSIGLKPDQAADMTQGFVCDVVLERGLLQAADPGRGRFRNLLLTALANYVRDRRRLATRQRRMPAAGPPASLDTMQGEPATDRRRTPEQAFTAQWASTLIGEVLEKVRTSCQADGLAAHWMVFERRVARPLLLGEDQASYAVLVEQLALDDVATAANMVVTVKRRVAAALRAEVGQTVDDPAEVETELRDLLGVLEGTR